MKYLFALLAWLPLTISAQTIPPVEPQAGLQGLVTLEIRLKGVPTLTNPSPTVKLYTWQLKNADSGTFILTIPCWNTTSACPRVIAATVRVFLKLPWANMNVTRFVLCNASECMLPVFPVMIAGPDESYRFSYDRTKAVWAEPPRIVSSWTQCAQEWVMPNLCAFTGRRAVRYGVALSTAQTKVAEAGFLCNNTIWGNDPAPTLSKTCWFSNETTAASITIGTP